MIGGSGSGSIPLTNASGSGSRRPQKIRFRRIWIRIRIRNTRTGGGVRPWLLIGFPLTRYRTLPSHLFYHRTAEHLLQKSMIRKVDKWSSVFGPTDFEIQWCRSDMEESDSFWLFVRSLFLNLIMWLSKPPSIVADRGGGGGMFIPDPVSKRFRILIRIKELKCF